MSVVVQQGLRYAEYNSSGQLHSWWIKLPGAKKNYVEKLNCFSDRAFLYDVDFCEPKNKELSETDGWPRQYPGDQPAKAKPKKKRKTTAEELLS